jgi:hypothetical protein
MSAAEAAEYGLIDHVLERRDSEVACRLTVPSGFAQVRMERPYAPMRGAGLIR